MSIISDNLHSVQAQIASIGQQFTPHFPPARLLAVSKTQSIQAIEHAYAAGQRCFGENYVAEGVEKIIQLKALKQIDWHFIGALQSNKTRLVAEHFDWVQSIERLKIAQRLSEQRPDHLKPLQVCIQVNLDQGGNKSGCEPSEVFELAAAIARLAKLELRGLMFIPEPTPDFEAALAVFTSGKRLFDQLKKEHPQIDTLSMGMSADLKAAIASGSSMVRIGTAIFGVRS